MEEKISSMAAKKEIFPDEKANQTNLINSIGPPMPSPRNVNRKSNENLEQYFNLDVQTPIPTPSQSPPPSPIKPLLTPQISAEKSIQNNIPPVIMPQINNLDEYEVSLLEETLQNEDDNCNYFNLVNRKISTLIIVII